MKYGITLPPFGPFADPNCLVQRAVEAEKSGWDGFFIWDHMIFNEANHPIADPWISLAAIACATHTIRIGAMITPLARRRPWKLARETACLDRLSNGRMTLGVGLGAPPEFEFGAFGEETNARIRAQKLDEGLDIVTGLWSGEPFSYEGEHYQLAEVAFRPRPVQEPRIPIWVGGGWSAPAPMRRAARYDGVFALNNGGKLSLDELRHVKRFIESERAGNRNAGVQPFDYVAAGITPADDVAAGAEIVAPYIEAGATWWLETADPWSATVDWSLPLDEAAVSAMNDRLSAPPPRM